MMKQEMLAKLCSMGLTRKYKPYWEGDASGGSICLETRKFGIHDGELSGSMVSILDDKTISVWTSRKKKANDIARVCGFKVKNYDGEADLHLPADKADHYLHALGAKVKKTRVLTPEQRVAVAARFAKARKTALAVPV